MGLESAKATSNSPHCWSTEQTLLREALHQGFQTSMESTKELYIYILENGWVPTVKSFIQSVLGVELRLQIKAPWVILRCSIQV